MRAPINGLYLSYRNASQRAWSCVVDMSLGWLLQVACWRCRGTRQRKTAATMIALQTSAKGP